MSMASYKHAVTVTSQLYFCSSPIRLDSYNKCQFGCAYCFSRSRNTDKPPMNLRSANASAFRDRLKRVACGSVRSVLDEFLRRRVPIQLGGLQDPFMPYERQAQTTLALLETLRDHDYPTLVSTKGALFLESPYLEVIKEMDIYIRLSAAAVPEVCRASLEMGCDSFSVTKRKIEKLSKAGIPVSLRIQPIIPGFENEGLRMVREAAEAGVRHVSFEHLKLSIEDRGADVQRISEATGVDLWKLMIDRGIQRIGRDYALLAPSKRDFLSAARSECRSSGVAFGAGDTEFIHESDGGGCCNGSGLFLRGGHQFTCNLVGVLSGRRAGDAIRFVDFKAHWSPVGGIHNYLTTNSRTRSPSKTLSSWMTLLEHRWNGSAGPYSPMLFAGVSWKGDYDSHNRKIYRFESVL